MANTISTTSRSRTSTLGWAVLVGLNALLILNSLLLYLMIATEGLEQTVSILLAGLALFGLVLAIDGFRSSSKQNLRYTWITVVVMLTLGIHISITGDVTVGIFYLILTIFAFAGQFLAGRA
jgi:hypothetical protein